MTRRFGFTTATVFSSENLEDHATNASESVDANLRGLGTRSVVKSTWLVGSLHWKIHFLNDGFYDGLSGSMGFLHLTPGIFNVDI